MKVFQVIFACNMQYFHQIIHISSCTQKYFDYEKKSTVYADNVPYTAELSSGKTFAVVHKIHYLRTVHKAVAIMYCTQQVI